MYIKQWFISRTHNWIKTYSAQIFSNKQGQFHVIVTRHCNIGIMLQIFCLRVGKYSWGEDRNFKCKAVWDLIHEYVYRGASLDKSLKI